jgi:hypothetical protein
MLCYCYDYVACTLAKHMPQLIAWGNNVAGNLDPETQESFITKPSRICESQDVKAVLWTSWTSTITKG